MRRSVACLTLLLTTACAAPAAAHMPTHQVAPGETLWGIATANGLPAATLAAANGVPADYLVIAGTTLKIPAAGATPAAPGATAAPAPIAGYRVRVGDTLTGIAAAHGIPIQALAAANGVPADYRVIAGTTLRLAVTEGTVPSMTPAATGTGPAAAAGRMTANEIASIAAQQGVDGSLAAAIAWQESGFNNAMVSPANARGIMQIIPSTWEYVRTSLARHPLDPASPHDNVRAGSILLADLLRRTGDPEMAAAAYYQGLGSLQSVGMLPSTRQYVANVMALRGRFGGA